jgi:hypothetical protein
MRKSMRNCLFLLKYDAYFWNRSESNLIALFLLSTQFEQTNCNCTGINDRHFADTHFFSASNFFSDTSHALLLAQLFCIIISMIRLCINSLLEIMARRFSRFCKESNVRVGKIVTPIISPQIQNNVGGALCPLLLFLLPSAFLNPPPGAATCSPPLEGIVPLRALSVAPLLRICVSPPPRL